jgi:AcrR family transcriptional regulator
MGAVDAGSGAASQDSPDPLPPKAARTQDRDAPPSAPAARAKASRTGDRREELLQKIIAYMADHGIDELSYRKLADALGVSPYTLVYHFGKKDELLTQVIHAIERSEWGLFGSGNFSAEAQTEEWEWGLRPENQPKLRLIFEAAMLEARSPGRFGEAIHLVLPAWHTMVERWLRQQGLSTAHASTEARLFVDTVLGLQFDLVLTGRQQETTTAFRAALQRLEQAISHTRTQE